MYKISDYSLFESIVNKISRLENVNRAIDIESLSSNSIIKNEVILEFASTNTIEGDFLSTNSARLLVNKNEQLSNTDLEKRWIGIKRASEFVWSGSFEFDLEHMHGAHRALLRDVKESGGVFKTKINQVGSLVTAHPEDVNNLMMNLFINVSSSAMTLGWGIHNIVPFVSEFLAIHPYEDGNGRMSRLLMNFLLHKAGFKFAKHISITKFLVEDKDRYIQALEKRNNAWASNAMRPQDLVALFDVLLDSILLAAQEALEISNLKKINKVDFKKQVLKKSTEFSFSEIRSFVKSSLSDATYKVWIKEMLDEKLISKKGELKNTKYKVAN